MTTDTLTRYAIRLTFRAYVPATNTIKEVVCYLKTPIDYPYDRALKIEELGIEIGEQPRWFISYEEAERVRDRVRPAARRALTFWIATVPGVDRKQSVVSLEIIPENKLDL